jgi:hypothetical protein
MLVGTGKDAVAAAAPGELLLWQLPGARGCDAWRGGAP